MKKTTYKLLIVISLLSSSITALPYFSSVQIVQAKTTAIKRKLYHKSYVYNSKGKVTGVLPKGTSLKTFGSKTIQKVKYYKIGANQYIKQANFSKSKISTTTKTATSTSTKTSTTSTKKQSTNKTNLKTAKEVISYLNKKKGKKDWFVLSGTSEKNDFYYVLDNSGHNYMVYTDGTIKKVK